MSTADDDGRFDDRLASQTATYFDRIEECVAQLPRLIEQYADDGPYHRTAERIRDLETECDTVNRQICGLITNAAVDDLGVRLTRIHLHAGQIVELYRLLDEIPNVAEQFAEQLVAIEPERSGDCLAVLERMAGTIVDAASFLRVAVSEYVHALCRPEGSTAVVEEVQQIRGAESDGDGLRNEVISTAFADGGVEHPLVYREFALLLDEILDATEDVTDQMIFTIGNQSWFEVEPDDRLPSA